MNLSNNNLTNESVRITGPMNLQDVDLAHNKITSLKVLDAPRFLTRLCIDCKGFCFFLLMMMESMCVYLTDNLDNRIDDLEPISNCSYLKEINLDGNSVYSLSPLKRLPLKIIRAVRIQHN